MPEADWFYAVVGPTAVVAGLIRGFAGFGGPLLLLPVLNLYLPPAASIPVLVLIDLLANVRLLPEGLRLAARPVVTPLTIGTVVAMPLGILILSTADPLIMKRLISGAILAAALLLLSGWRYRGRITTAGWMAIGGLTGVVMGATTIAVTAALFLNAGAQTAAEGRANFIVWAFLAGLALLGMVAITIGMSSSLFSVIAILGVLYVAGSAIGASLVKRAPDLVVRRIILLLVLCVATAGLML
jgi:uncharacterized protein